MDPFDDFLRSKLGPLFLSHPSTFMVVNLALGGWLFRAPVSPRWLNRVLERLIPLSRKRPLRHESSSEGSRDPGALLKRKRTRNSES